MKTRVSLLIAWACAMPAHAEPEMVVLVRHAERATVCPQGHLAVSAPPGGSPEARGGPSLPCDPKADPDLTPAGQARAKALAAALEHAGVTAIITTKFQRTRATAAPLAAARGITPLVVESQKGEDHAAIVAAAVKQLSGVVLVVGHSNTVPAIAAALGAPRLIDFCESSYSHMLIVQGGKHLVRSSYGEPDMALPTAGCQ